MEHKNLHKGCANCQMKPHTLTTFIYVTDITSIYLTLSANKIFAELRTHRRSSEVKQYLPYSRNPVWLWGRGTSEHKLQYLWKVMFHVAALLTPRWSMSTLRERDRVPCLTQVELFHCDGSSTWSSSKQHDKLLVPETWQHSHNCNTSYSFCNWYHISIWNPSISLPALYLNNAAGVILELNPVHIGQRQVSSPS